MDASAFFSAGGTPPGGPPPGGGGGPPPGGPPHQPPPPPTGPPPRAPPQHPQRQAGHPPPRRPPQGHHGHGQMQQRSHSRDSADGANFETLDLNSNPASRQCVSQGGNFSSYHAAATAKSGPENFSHDKASSQGENFSSYNASSQGENFSHYNASSQGENFGNYNSNNAQPPPNVQRQRGQSGEETFEYEGVALQTALNAFGNVAGMASSVAGGVVGNVAGAARTVGGGGIGGVVGAVTSVTPSRLAGNMASWRGRIADVVAPVGPTPGSVPGTPTTGRPPMPPGHGTGLAPPITPSGSMMDYHQQQQQQQLQHPTPTMQRPPSPMVPQPQPYPQQPPPYQQSPQPYQQSPNQHPSGTPSGHPMGMAGGGAPPTYGRTPSATSTGSAAEVFAAPSPQASPLLGPATVPGGIGGPPPANAQSFFGAPPTAAAGAMGASAQPQPQQQPVSGNSWQMVPTSSAARNNGAGVGGNGGATEFFGAPPAPAANPQRQPLAQPQQQAPATAEELFSQMTAQTAEMPTTEPMSSGQQRQPQPVPPRRQLSHQLSALEKATHDPTTFQYADPLEGRATIVPGRNVVNGGDAGGAIGTNGGDGMSAGGGGVGAGLGANVNIAAGASSTDLHSLPAAPPTGGLTAMEVGRYLPPAAAATPMTAMEMFQSDKGPEQQEPPVQSEPNVPVTAAEMFQAPTHPTADATPVPPEPSVEPPRQAEPDSEAEPEQQQQPPLGVPATPSAATAAATTVQSEPPAKPLNLPTPRRTATPSTKATPRRLNLPVPKKTNLPLPPPMSARKKIPKPPGSGNAPGSLLSGSSGKGGASHFRKPPPLEVRATGASPRFHVPPPAQQSPREELKAGRMSPLPSPRVDAKSGTEGPRVPTLPLPSPRVESMAAPVPSPAAAQPTVAVPSPRVGAPPLPSPRAQPPMSIPSPRASEPPALAPRAIEPVPPPVASSVGVVPSPTAVEDVATPEAMVPPPPFPPAVESSPLAAAAVNEELAPSAPPMENNTNQQQPSTGATSDDWNMVAESMVRGAVEDAVSHVATNTSYPPAVPPVASPPLAPKDAAFYPGATPAPTPAHPAMVPSEESVPPLATSTVVGAFSAAQLPFDGTRSRMSNLHPANLLPETLPDAASSRVTECDAMSDYQGLVREEDVPPETPVPPPTMQAAESPAEAENASPESGVLVELPNVPASSMIVEADGMSDYQDQLKEEDLPPAEELEGLPEELVTEDENALPDGWVEAADPASGNVYYYHEATGATQWHRPDIEGKGAVDEPAAPEGDEPAATVEDFVQAEVQPLPAEETQATELLTSEIATDGQEAAAVEEEHGDDAAAEGPRQVEEELISEDASQSGNALPEGWTEAADPSSGSVYYYNEITGETQWEMPVAVRDSVEEPPEEEPESAPTMEEMAAENVPKQEDAMPDAPSTAHESPAESEPVATEPEEEMQAAGDTSLDNSWDPTAEEESSPAQASSDPTQPPLLEGWVESTDPTSGNVYYYNADTGESRWERPSIEVAVEATAADQNAAEEEIAQEPAVDEPMEELLDDDWASMEPEPEPTSDLRAEPPAVDAGADTSAGEEHPDDVSANTEPSVPTEPSAQTEESALPEGWTEASDPNSGNIYYYNEITGETTWDRPVMQPASDDVAATDKPPVEDEPLAEDAALEAPVEEDTPSAAPEAVHVAAPATESVVNSGAEATGVDVDVRRDDNDEPLEEELSSAQEASPSDQGGVDASDQDALPEGWIEASDPNTGNIYYYNEVTGETTWDRPVMESAAGGEVPESESLPLEGEATLPQAEEVSESPSEQPVANAEADGRVEQIDEGWTEVDHPPAEEFTTDQTTEVVAEGEHQPSEVDEQAPLPDGLPEGWLESTDPTSGKTYYYNEVTGETSWDPPAPPSDQQSQAEGVVEECVQAGSVEEPEQQPPAVESDASDRVGESSEAMSGGDAMAGEQQQDHPNKGKDSSDQEVPMLDEDREKPSDELPAGWAEAIDPTTGKIYYYHAETNQCVWERPVAEDVGEPKADKDVEEEREAEPTEPDVKEDADEAEAVEASEATQPSEESTLPDGWIETTDPSSGKTYYYNESSGETSWELPTASAEGPKEPKDVDSKELDDEPLEPVSEEASEPTEEAAQESSLPTSTEEDALPDGWTGTTDPSSGKIYYYNEVTGVTTWDRPTVENDVAADDVPPESSAADLDVAAETDQPKADDSVAGSVEKESAEDASLKLSPSMSLPEGWAEVIDPSSGKAYYYNEASGETTWERPQMQPSSTKGPVEALGATSTQTSQTASPAAEHRPRPSHAIASFGFGGRLCVMIPQVAASLSGGVVSHLPGERPNMRRGPVVIHRLRTLIPADNEYSIPSPGSVNTAVSPLIKTDEDKVLSYLSEKSSHPDNLLWNVINIAAQNRGRLRNDKAAKKAIVDLLLASSSEARQTSLKSSTTANTPSASDLEEVQELLLRGDREAAVSEALTNKNYALALVIASMCDRKTYQITARRFGDEALPAGSPLRLATLLFSNNLELPRDEELLDPTNENSLWCGDEYKDLVATWREQLASILSNQTPGWERIVLTLGDRLLQLGQCQAAHVCYLVSFCQFGQPSSNTTRLVLLGVDHKLALNRLLMTPESIQSFERTEAFEWARRRGNRKTHIPTLQPFKLRYSELLADFGHEALAKEYLLSIRSCIGLDDGSDPKVSAAIAMHGEEFIESLKMLDDRICVSIGAERSSWDYGKNDQKGAASALGSIVKSVLGKKPKAEAASDTARHDKIDEQPPSEPELSVPLPADPHKMPHPDETAESLPEADESFATAKLELPKSPTVLSNPFSHGMGDAAGLGVEITSDKAAPKEEQGPPSSAPAMFGDTLSDNLGLQPSLPKEEEKKEQIAPSTPAQPAKSEGKKKKAPASEPVKTPRSGGWFSKLLGRDSESKAKVADVGEEMQAYYDEKLKRWIFPGDDPAEVAKPLAPPPIIPKKTDDAPATPAAPDTSNDPLAALMAPPSNRGMSSRKKGTPLAGRYADPLASMGNVSTNKNKLPPASPMMNQAPPTFAVFKPTPVSKKPDEDEKK